MPEEGFSDEPQTAEAVGPAANAPGAPAVSKPHPFQGRYPFLNRSPLQTESGRSQSTQQSYQPARILTFKTVFQLFLKVLKGQIKLNARRPFQQRGEQQRPQCIDGRRPCCKGRRGKGRP